MLLHYFNMKLTNDITWRSFLKCYVLNEDKIKISKFDSFVALIPYFIQNFQLHVLPVLWADENTKW